MTTINNALAQGDRADADAAVPSDPARYQAMATVEASGKPTDQLV